MTAEVEHLKRTVRELRGLIADYPDGDVRQAAKDALEGMRLLRAEIERINHIITDLRLENQQLQTAAIQLSTEDTMRRYGAVLDRLGKEESDA